MSKEAIEALESARAHILDAYRIWQADDVSAVPPPKSGAGSVIAKIDAVLSAPISVEGKVAQLEWRYSEHTSNWYSDTPFSQYIAWEISRNAYYLPSISKTPVRAGTTIDEAKAAAQADYETRILSALISSPGKDGGQEVEAAEWQGRYWIEDEGRWSNWITNPVGYPWAYDLQEGKSEIRYLYPQPASTALVERLKERGQAFANQVRLITHLLHGQAYSTTVAELNAFDSALSASTSREGESRG